MIPAVPAAGSQLHPWMTARPLPRRLRWELALCGALLLHVPFLLFRLGPAAPPDSPRNHRPRSVFIPSAAPHTPSEKELLAWVQLADPTLLSLPDPAVGFSAPLLAPAPHAYTERVTPAPTATQIAERTFAPPDPPPTRSLEADLTRQWPVRIPATPEPPAIPALPAAVLWRFADGALLRGMGELPAADLRLALRTGAPRQPTRFRVELPLGAPARVRLQASCGNSDLDRLALQRLGPRVLTWEQDVGRRELSPETEPFTLDPGRSRVVEVEWRLAPGG